MKTTREQRIEAKQNLTDNLLVKLKEVISLHEDTRLRLSCSSLEVFLVEADDHNKKIFASDVEFFNSTNWEDRNADNLEINFGSSGSFTPENVASFNRTKHAMEFLNNWEESTKIILAFMKQLKRLEETWSFENEMSK